MEKLVRYFNRLLLKDKKLLEYLHRRGISDESIDKFKLGKFPKNPLNVLKYAEPDRVVDSMMIYGTKQGFKSNFTLNPLMIPLFDVYGDVVGFAGRAIDNKLVEDNVTPKYWNTVYKKSMHLYGLNFAKETAQNKDAIFVVEGYTDVISAHQRGFTNVVASCGTMLSGGQMNLLARYATKIHLLLDNDGAGDSSSASIMKKYASRKGIEMIPMRLLEFNDLDELLVSGKPPKDYIKKVRRSESEVQ
jgi:DNA primase